MDALSDDPAEFCDLAEAVPLRWVDGVGWTELARREGEALVAHLHSLGMTDEEIASDDSVEMTIEEMNAWLLSGAPSPFAGR